MVISLNAFAQSNAIRCVEGFKGNDNFLFLRFDHYGVGTKKSKFLKTKNGLEEVSNIDNYKGHFTTADKMPSLYIKIEVSDSAAFETDKEIIVDNYQLLLQSTKRVNPKVDTLTIKGTNFYGYTKSEIDSAVSIASWLAMPVTAATVFVAARAPVTAVFPVIAVLSIVKALLPVTSPVCVAFVILAVLVTIADA